MGLLMLALSSEKVKLGDAVDRALPPTPLPAPIPRKAIPDRWLLALGGVEARPVVGSDHKPELERGKWVGGDHQLLSGETDGLKNSLAGDIGGLVEFDNLGHRTGLRLVVGNDRLETGIGQSFGGQQVPVWVPGLVDYLDGDLR